MDETVPEAAASDEAPQLSAADLQAALLESQRRERDANARAEAERVRLDNLIRTAVPLQQPSAPAPEKLSAMPDPAVDPDGFERWISQRDAARERQLRQELDQRESSINQRQAAATLWQQFSTRYPEYSRLQQLASVAFQQVIPGFGGVIPADPSQVDSLMDAVKRSMDDMRGAPGTTPNRTGGVSGGSPSPRPPKAPQVNEEKFPSMSDDILTYQQDAGLI